MSDDINHVSITEAVKRTFSKASTGEDVVGTTPKDADISTTSHNRFLTLTSSDTFPNNDTFSVTWKPSEGVTRYRVWVETFTAGGFVKICEDAANALQAGVWLEDPMSSQTADVPHFRVFAATVTTTTGLQTAGWSEWQEFPEGYALSRLDFLGSISLPMNIWIEAE